MTPVLRPSRLLLLVLVAGTLSLTACRKDAAEPAEAPADTTALPPAAMSNTVVDVAMADDQFSTLVDLVRTAGLDSTLRGAGPFTVFAPTNEAFSKLPAGTLDTLRLEKNRQQLTDLLLYHVANGNMKATDLAGMATVSTALAGASFSVNASGASPVLTDVRGRTATVVSADAAADNGTIHVIDAVLMPAAPSAPAQ
jgi:uncharacterized surface protein with fasciclin (FAS1) repeats